MTKLFAGGWPVLLAVMLYRPGAYGFPPAPDGVIYGLVKDQYGTPLSNSGDQVILQTPAGVQVTCNIQSGLAVGVNYALSVPMDFGVSPDPYAPDALFAGAQYKLYVTVATTTNLPIEMTGTNRVLGAPAQQTQQDLTLGADANGDGIPDAWEQLFLSEIGKNLPLASINPNADYARDGRTLEQEYLLGNYPFNPTNSFNVQLVSHHAGSAVLAFTTITGRDYAVLGSPDLKHWTPVAFTIPATGAPAATSYYAPKIQRLQIQTVQPANAPVMQFFRLQLQ